MQGKIRKWGNSQGLRLSKDVLEMASIQIGDDVEIAVTDGQIVVKKARRSKYDLAELVSRIPKDYLPEEVDFGAPRGREEW
jgi:antitoxin MazE